MCTCDERAIERVMFTYARCVDSADWEGLGDLFRYGQVHTEGSDAVVVGGDAVRDLWRSVNRVHQDGTLRTRHVLTNIIVDVSEDGEEASAQSYFMVFQATDRLPLQPIVGGRYEDTFRKVAGSWWFTSKEIHVDQVGDVTEHLVIALDSSGRPGDLPRG